MVCMNDKYTIAAIRAILRRGNDVEIKRTKKGIAIIESTKKIVYRDEEHSDEHKEN